MKETKICPKCQHTEIYTNAGMSKSGERGYIPISSWSKLFFDVYLCVACGYVEEYISDEDLKNEKSMEKIRGNWKKG
jgi:hypothetical protein